MTMQILIWWLVVQAFGLAGLPLARFLFSALPDRGYAFAKALGLLLSAYLAWLIAMLGLAPFGAALIAASALAVYVVGILATREHRAANGAQPASAGSRYSIRDGWRLVLGYEVLFA